MRRSHKRGGLSAGFRLQNGIVDDDRVGARRGSAYEIPRRSENLDAAEGMKGEKVGIAGHDQLRRAVDGKLKKLVVLWVAADLYDACDRDSVGKCGWIDARTPGAPGLRHRRQTSDGRGRRPAP